METKMFANPTFIYLVPRSPNVNPKPQVALVGEDIVQTQFPCLCIGHSVEGIIFICTELLDFKIIFLFNFFFSTEKIGDDWVITDLLFSESSLHLSGIKFPAYRLTHKRLVVTVTLFVRIPASHTQCTFNQCITWFGQRLCLKEYYPLQSQ